MTRRFLKIVLLVLGLGALMGGGLKLYTDYRMDGLANSLQKAKEKRAAQQKQLAAAELEGSDSPSEVESAPQEDKLSKTPERAAVNSKTYKTRQPSACSSVYQKYIENRKISEVGPTAADDMMELSGKDMENDPCVQQLTDVIDMERFIELMKTCKVEPNMSDDSKRACLSLMTIGWSVFAEMEYRHVDPSEIPPDALHSKINFRLIEFKKFMKESDPEEKEYLFRLLDQMHKLRPDIDYGTARDELIAEFYKRDPQTWKDDFGRILDELETQDILRAVMTFYEAHGRKTDKAFFDYVDGLVKQYPDNQVAHIYKGHAHGGLNEWDQAAKELAEAERLGPQKHTDLLAELRQSIQERKSSVSTHTRWSISIELPDANLTN